MEFKAYNFEEEKKCVICKKEDSISTFDSVNNKNNIIIDLNTKNVENIYDFFRDNILISILHNNEELSIDYTDIKKESFYKEDSFQELMNLLNNLVIQSNNAITECISVSESEKKEDD